MAPPSRSNPQSPTTFAPESFDHSNRRISFPGAPVQYRIEERRRTVYVRATAPPSEWDQQTMDGILGLAQSAEPNDASEHMIDQDFFLSRHWTPQTPGSEIRDAGPDSPYGSPTTPTQRSLGAYTRPRLLFYHSHDPHYGFTNFSPHPVLYQGRRYPTSEHLFQSFKFEHRPNLAEHIRTCSERPSVAFAEARRFAPEVRPDWMEANIAKMDEAIWYKFTQHDDLRLELLMTGDAELIEDSDKDAFWGIGADRKGRNELGKALERLREKLRSIAP